MRLAQRDPSKGLHAIATRLTSGCTGARAAETVLFGDGRRAGPVNLDVRRLLMTRREASPVLMRVLAAGTALVLLSLALLHIYWAAGGNLGMGSVIPTVGGKPVFSPS